MQPCSKSYSDVLDKMHELTYLSVYNAAPATWSAVLYRGTGLYLIHLVPAWIPVTSDAQLEFV